MTIQDPGAAERNPEIVGMTYAVIAFDIWTCLKERGHNVTITEETPRKMAVECNGIPFEVVINRVRNAPKTG